jgi:hypothetical protein
VALGFPFFAGHFLVHFSPLVTIASQVFTAVSVSQIQAVALFLSVCSLAFPLLARSIDCGTTGFAPKLVSKVGSSFIGLQTFYWIAVAAIAALAQWVGGAVWGRLGEVARTGEACRVGTAEACTKAAA